MNEIPETTAGLLQAFLAWQPGDPPLEEQEGFQSYLESAPANRMEIQILQQFLKEVRDRSMPTRDEC